MHWFGVCFCIVFLAAVATCQAVYYDAAKDQADAQKYYAALQQDPALLTLENVGKLLTTSHKFQPNYDEARKNYLYPSVDRQPDGSLRCVYRNITVSGNEYNCEHTVPQSWFQEKLPMRGDLHHLFTAEMKCNGFRSNFPYRDPAGFPERHILEGCGALFSDDDTYFVPNNNKGAVARAWLYFLTRYQGLLSHQNMPYVSVKTVVQWSKQNEVSLWEKHRNAEIFGIQGNRNPFIDYPEWVDQFDFEKSLN